MEIGFFSVLRAQITFSGIAEFVWRSDASFLNGTKIRGVLRAYFTFSGIAEFVNLSRYGIQTCGAKG